MEDKAARKAAKQQAKEAEKAKRKQEKMEAKAKRDMETKNMKIGWQYFLGSIVAIGGFNMGTAIGWGSPAGAILRKDYNATDTDVAWVSSAFALGAAFAQFFAVLFIKYLGLKYTLCLVHVLTGLAWIPIMQRSRIWVIVIGRLCLGIAGIFCIACPVYNAEMAHKTHRGTLGVFFQFFLTIGILYSYGAGAMRSLNILNIACVCWCVAGFLLTIVLVPQSPFHLVRLNKETELAALMKRIRGKDYDPSKEISEIQASSEVKESFAEGMKQKANVKAFMVLFAMHIFQQITGINAILYHAHGIFEKASDMSEDMSVIIVGIAQVAITGVSAVAVDRAGRVLLFALSLAIMCATLGMVGLFFTIRLCNASLADTISVIPTIALVLYICGFSLGVGPLPWVMIGEYLPPNVKNTLGMVAAFFNNMLAFGISWMMPLAMTKMRPDIIFYIFALVSFIGIIFTLMFVLETNQKTFEEIQNDLNKYTVQNPFKKRTPTKQ